MPPKREKKLVHVDLRPYIIALAAIWTLLFLSLTLFSAYKGWSHARELATNEAYAHINKDTAFRFWGISHNTIYVPVDDRTIPDPYLAHIPERVIKTPSGKELTIINPARIIRQINEEYGDLYGVPGRVTSKTPLRAENAPDAWETKALNAFEQGKRKFSEFTIIKGKPYLRMMQPMVAQKGCVACHPNYTVGEVSGGVGVSVAMDPFYAHETKNFIGDFLSHTALWLLGLLGISIISKKLQHQETKHFQSQNKLAITEGIKGAILESALDCIITIDKDGNIIEFNPAAEKTFGYSRDEVIGKELAETIIPEGLRERHRKGLERQLQGGTMKILGSRIETKAKHRNGSIFPVELAISRLDIRGNPLFTATLRDISDRQDAETALRESEERYALAAQGANDGLWDWDMRSGKVYYSERWKEIVGHKDKEDNTDIQTWLSRVHPDDIQQLRNDLHAHLENVASHFINEHRILHADGSYHWVISRGYAIRDNKGSAYRIAGSINDITERKQAEEQLRYDAFHDALTGLSNRALFMEQVEHAIAISQRNPNYQFAVLFLDLDRFKIINDSLGHTLGDELLVVIARRIEKCIRAGDMVARWGGDEFTVLLEDISDLDSVFVLAERIHEEIGRPVKLNDLDLFTTVSTGITWSKYNYNTAEEVLRDADIAMYEAKKTGKARHVLFDDSLHSSAIALLHLETDLRKALEKNQFTLVYQPIISFDSGLIEGFEALLRWEHPKHGMISPLDFIPLAEETGLILPIGEWVLTEACKQLRSWQEQFTPELWMSVNVSGKQLFESDMPQLVRSVIKQTELNPDTLKLELTESLLIEKSEKVVTIMEGIKELGVHLSIDDFGTGYSSMSYLHIFPIDTLKIDRAFVSRIEKEGRETVRAIIDLANNLILDVIAEGVENEAQIQRLKSLGCPQAQGYYFSPPDKPEVILQLLEEKKCWTM